MTQAQFARRHDRATAEPFVISQTDRGFRIYAVSDPGKIHEVSGTPDAPTCTCPDFRFHRNDPNWRCKHILAVSNQHTPKPKGNGSDESYETEERTAVQAEGRRRTPKRVAGTGNGATQMLLKRSVSPDGRIDALSVEFSCPVADLDGSVRERALETLSLQAQIIQDFLQRNGKSEIRTDSPVAQPEATSEGTPAEILSIGGMNGKWGRRLFLTIQANGRRLRFFGTQKQLADAITAAGFPERATSIAEDVTLNLPCRVRTEPSDDGRYVNVVEVLPAEPARSPGRRL